jgi:crotonobetainyl-CoA:carnitine CoA-transferase CaiB-like acyl-CoA transferase
MASPHKPLPLSHLRVLDVSQVMAGPFCCMLLGDMGADVIKVEPPGAGDQTRRAMGFKLKGEDSGGFIALNRNKRSIELNLKTEAGLEVFYELVRGADVLVENNRPGVVSRLKIDYPTLKKINPKLVYASITGFGQTGPWAGRPGLDLIAQAMTGVMSVTGYPDMAPVKSSVPIADLGAGLFAVYGILSAVLGREHTGEGQFIDASLFDSALGLSIWETAEFWGTGKVPVPIASANRMSAPYQAVRASDRYFVIGAANQKLWQALCQVIERPELLDDARFASNGERLRNRVELMKEIEKSFASRPAQHWVDALLAAGVPAAPIYDYGESLASEQVEAREMVMAIEHPVEGSVKSLGFPVKLSETPQQVRHPAPLLGQHTEQVLAELGIRGSAVAALGARGAFSR